MYCTNCGNKLGDNGSFCPNCGSKINCVTKESLEQPELHITTKISKIAQLKNKHFVFSAAFSLLSIIFLFVPGSFAYIFESDFISSSRTTSYGSFNYLISRTNADIVILGIIISLVLSTVLIHTINSILGKNIKILDIFSSFFALASYIFFFLVGAATFTTTSSSNSPIYGKITQSFYFNKPWILFFIEVLLLFSLIVLAFINAKRSKKSKEQS